MFWLSLKANFKDKILEIPFRAQVSNFKSFLFPLLSHLRLVNESQRRRPVSSPLDGFPNDSLWFNMTFEIYYLKGNKDSKFLNWLSYLIYTRSKTESVAFTKLKLSVAAKTWIIDLRRKQLKLLKPDFFDRTKKLF